MTTLLQHLPASRARSYPIIVEPNALDRIAHLAAAAGNYDNYVILYDEKLAKIAQQVASHLPKAIPLSVPSGEASKSFGLVEEIAKKMLDHHVTRNSLLLNIGGGMLTDLGGFIGSIFMRGIDFIHISTSLLGMVDAGVGGKTGIDLGSAKNMIGTINHPRAIIIDTTVLGTLPDQQLREGLVEVIKMAALLNADIFTWLGLNTAGILQRHPDRLQTCIEHAIKMKISVVEADERESDRRMFLNFGHTIGHALEALSGFTISHGQAVSIGMVAEMTLTNCPVKTQVTALLQQVDMPVTLPKDYALEKLWSMMKRDKKSFGSEVRLAVPTTLGSGEIRTITEDDFLHLIK